MRKQEMLMLSGKERDRMKVLREVKRGHLTQRWAAGQRGVTDRWVRKLLVRIKQEGDGGIVHRLRGRESNRRLPESRRAKVLKLVKAKYGDFGPTLACEYLAEDDGVEVSKETLRQLADGRRVAAGEAAPSGGGARVAAAAELSGRDGAVGHLGARRAERAGPAAVLGGHDR
jgi:hypothetical protein